MYRFPLINLSLNAKAFRIGESITITETSSSKFDTFFNFFTIFDAYILIESRYPSRNKKRPNNQKRKTFTANQKVIFILKKQIKHITVKIQLIAMTIPPTLLKGYMTLLARVF